MKHKKLLLLIVLPVLALLLLTGLFFLPKEEAAASLSVLDTENTETYDFSYVTRGDLELWANITCKFQSLQQERLRFSLGGRTVGRVYVEVGDNVTPGQLLAELENEELDAQLEAAQKEVNRLNRELNFARTNLEIVHSSWSLYDQWERYELTASRLEEDSALAAQRLEELQAQKRNESLYAGIEGTVTFLRSNETSSTETDSIVISDRQNACLYADTEYYDRMIPGMEVTLTTEENSIQAVVTEASELGFETPEVTGKGVRRVYFVPKNGISMITDSSKVSLQLLLDSRQDVLLVKARAVFFVGEQAYVFYENENGVREPKPVELGLLANSKYEVLSGLTEGEALIVG